MKEAGTEEPELRGELIRPEGLRNVSNQQWPFSPMMVAIIFKHVLWADTLLNAAHTVPSIILIWMGITIIPLYHMDKQRLGFSNLPGNTEGKHFRTMTGRQLSLITKPVPSVYTQLHWLAKVFSTAGGKSFSPKPFRKMGPWRVHREASWCCKKLDWASAITAPYRGASTSDNKAGPKLVLRKTAMKTAFIHSQIHSSFVEHSLCDTHFSWNLTSS